MALYSHFESFYQYIVNYGGLNMRVIFAAAMTMLLAAPAVATSYSGSGTWNFVNPFGAYAASPPISWSFTVGSQINSTTFNLASFNFTAGSQSWTLADFASYYSQPTPIFVQDSVGNEVFFSGTNANGAVLFTGIRLVGTGPRNSFMVNDPGSFTVGYTAGGTMTGLSVPEPASWAMLIAGFGLVGAVARRRRPALAC